MNAILKKLGQNIKYNNKIFFIKKNEDDIAMDLII